MFLEDFVTSRDEVRWSYTPLFDIGSRVVLFTHAVDDRPIHIHGVVTGEIVAYHKTDCTYLMRSKHLQYFPGWRYLSITDDQAEVIRDYDYSYTIPDPLTGEAPKSPLEVLLSRIQNDVYTPLYNLSHPDHENANPLVVEAIKAAFQFEVVERVHLLKRDVLFAYGLTGTSEGERLWIRAWHSYANGTLFLTRQKRRMPQRIYDNWSAGKYPDAFTAIVIRFDELFATRQEPDTDGYISDLFPKPLYREEEAIEASEADDLVDYHMPNNHFVG